jgi:protein O-mannosyl-transferase
MLNEEDTKSPAYILLMSAVSILAVFAVFGPVLQCDFVTLDDYFYIVDNSNIQSGVLQGLRWAFSTTYGEFWHPLTWLSLMLDYQLYGLDASGYHLTNLILHILSTVLLFWLFRRITGDIWKSAFAAAALFALHPLRVESVAWVAERKDVLSVFFSILTLCLYAYYVEKQVVTRYLSVLFIFILALMSKPVVVILPVIMIILDYWPLNRFAAEKDNPVIWQLKEKTPFFILSAFFSLITIYAQYNPSVKHTSFPVVTLIANAPVSCIIYLKKIFWPHELAVFYPFSDQVYFWKFLGGSLFIIAVSAVVIIKRKHMPYVFAGWFWYITALLPVMGIQAGKNIFADRHTYLPSIGISIAIAWAVPFLIKHQGIRRFILFPTAILVLVLLSCMTWKQCGYWRDSVELFRHTLDVTKDNYLAHNNLGIAFIKEGRNDEAVYHYSNAIRIRQDFIEPYLNRGNAYVRLGRYKSAIEDYTEAIRQKPDCVEAYYNRGNVYAKLGRYRYAIEDYNKTITLKPDYTGVYNNMGIIYFKGGNAVPGCNNAQKACDLGNCKLLEAAKRNGFCF